jgi:hypothetical protein
MYNREFDNLLKPPAYEKQYIDVYLMPLWLYGMQYYGLVYENVSSPESSNTYVGKLEQLTDLYVFTYHADGMGGYIQGNHSANYGIRSDKFSFLQNRPEIWIFRAIYH